VLLDNKSWGDDLLCDTEPSLKFSDDSKSLGVNGKSKDATRGARRVAL